MASRKKVETSVSDGEESQTVMEKIKDVAEEARKLASKVGHSIVEHLPGRGRKKPTAGAKKSVKKAVKKVAKKAEKKVAKPASDAKAATTVAKKTGQKTAKKAMKKAAKKTAKKTAK